MLSITRHLFAASILSSLAIGVFASPIENSTSDSLAAVGAANLIPTEGNMRNIHSDLSSSYIDSEWLDRYWSSNKLHPFECKFGFLNSFPIGLPRCVQSDNIIEHMTMLNDIAAANDGNRAAGYSGYDESADYIKSTLEKYGYEVTYQPFPFAIFQTLGPGVLESDSQYEWNVDFRYMTHSEAGNVTADVTAVDLDLGPDNQSTSGCEASDFENFPVGHIALIQRGACTFQQKVENAAAAGAVGAIVFNQGNTDDRKDLIAATLSDDYAGGIPAFFATYDNGVAWSTDSKLRFHMVADVLRDITETNNVFAETKRGADDNIIMLGAHLDSVVAGAGINDNGSGSAALIEIAIQMRKAYPENKVRFAWWSAEESGLIGSTLYVNSLSEEELAKIKVYLNFDMISSPNPINTIYDGDGSDFGLEGPAGSGATEALFETYFGLRGQPAQGSEISFRSDYAQFFVRGVAFGGLFTGAGGIKTEEQVEIYGGTAGEPYDPCYHRECDDMNNIDQRALEVNADAAAFVTSWLSQSTELIDKEIDEADAISMRAKIPPRPFFNKRSVSSSEAETIERWGDQWLK